MCRIRPFFMTIPQSVLIASLAIACAVPSGCSRSQPENDAGTAANQSVEDETNALSPADRPSNVDADGTSEIPSPSDSIATGPTKPNAGSERTLPAANASPGPDSGSAAPAMDSTSPGATPGNGVGFPLAGNSTQTPANPVEEIPGGRMEGSEETSLAERVQERQLRKDLSPEQLMGFLEDSDRDMQLIDSGRSGIQDPREAAELMEAIARNKLKAAVQLRNHPGADPSQQIAGTRGHIQALSHLAAMGDVASAKALEALAKEEMDSDEPSIAMDSRIVMIGFAIDRLQAGKSGAAEEIVELARGIEATEASDIPSILILGQARELLSQYDQIEEAVAIREHLLKTFGNASDPMISRIASEAAGSAKRDSADRLLRTILENPEVALERWSEAAMELIADSPDLSTAQYLAQAALLFEDADRQAFVDETFSILQEQYDDPESATAREVDTAWEAYQARRKIIGTLFDPSGLPTVSGQPIPQSNLRGNVVLMPFWAMGFPASLQVVPMLEEIQQAHPNQVSIVGMNLDPRDANVREFAEQNELGFRSYRSISSATESVANPLAARFGLVSLPFVAILNQDGRVAALDFTGRNLKDTVENLINEAE
jgi:thiol-disulfide isomerase/thioredoxin